MNFKAHLLVAVASFLQTLNATGIQCMELDVYNYKSQRFNYPKVTLYLSTEYSGSEERVVEISNSMRASVVAPPYTMCQQLGEGNDQFWFKEVPIGDKAALLSYSRTPWNPSNPSDPSTEGCFIDAVSKNRGCKYSFQGTELQYSVTQYVRCDEGFIGDLCSQRIGGQPTTSSVEPNDTKRATASTSSVLSTWHAASTSRVSAKPTSIAETSTAAWSSVAPDLATSSRVPTVSPRGSLIEIITEDTISVAIIVGLAVTLLMVVVAAAVGACYWRHRNGGRCFNDRKATDVGLDSVRSHSVRTTRTDSDLSLSGLNDDSGSRSLSARSEAIDSTPDNRRARNVSLIYSQVDSSSLRVSALSSGRRSVRSTRSKRSNSGHGSIKDVDTEFLDDDQAVGTYMAIDEMVPYTMNNSHGTTAFDSAGEDHTYDMTYTQVDHESEDDEVIYAEPVVADSSRALSARLLRPLTHYVNDDAPPRDSLYMNGVGEEGETQRSPSSAVYQQLESDAIASDEPRVSPHDSTYSNADVIEAHTYPGEYLYDNQAHP